MSIHQGAGERTSVIGAAPSAAPERTASAQSGTSHAAALASIVIAAERRGASHAQAIALLERRARDLGVRGRDNQFGGLLQAGQSC